MENQSGFGQDKPNQINIKITDEILEGRYANMMETLIFITNKR